MTRLEVTGGDRGVQNVKFTGHQELKFDKIKEGLPAVLDQPNLNLVYLYLNATNIARNTLLYFNVRFSWKSGVLVVFLFRLTLKFWPKNHKNVDKI